MCLISIKGIVIIMWVNSIKDILDVKCIICWLSVICMCFLCSKKRKTSGAEDQMLTNIRSHQIALVATICLDTKADNQRLSIELEKYQDALLAQLRGAELEALKLDS